MECVVSALATKIKLRIKASAFLLFIGNCSTISNRKCTLHQIVLFWFMFSSSMCALCMFSMKRIGRLTMTLVCALSHDAKRARSPHTQTPSIYWRKRNFNKEEMCATRREKESEIQDTERHALGIAFCELLHMPFAYKLIVIHKIS